METGALSVSEQLRYRLRQQAAVAELGQLAIASRDPEKLMREACALVAMGLEVEFCKVLELLPNGTGLLLRAGTGWKEGAVGHEVVGADSDSQAGYTLKTRAPVIVSDMRREKRFTGPQLLKDHGIVSGISVVIYGAERDFGVMGAHTAKEREFSAEDVNFLQSVANILAAAFERLNTERQLARARDDFRSIFENSAHGIFRVTMSGQLITVNPAMAAIAGYDTPVEMIAEATDTARFYADPAEWENIWAEIMERGAIRNRLIEVKCRDGSHIWISLNGRLVRDESGNVLFMEGSIEDVSDRKQAEDDLTRANLRNRLILNAAGEGIFGVNSNGWLTFVNPAGASKLGYEASELIGLSAHETFHHSYPDGAAYPVGKCPVAQSVKKGAVSRVDDEVFWRKDGMSFPVEYISTPVPDGPEGGGAVIVFSDISARRKTEEMLRNVAEGVSGATGLPFFRSLVRYLADSLEADFAFVGELLEESSIRTIAVHARGESVENFEYDLIGTPCSNVVKDDLCIYPREVQKLFPDDSSLTEWDIEGYIGAPLRDSSGRTLGLLVVLGRRPFPDVDLAESMLRIFAVRAAAELEREHTEEEIRLLQNITMAISEAPDLETALEVTLREVCEVTGWVMGEAWVPDEQGEKLVCSKVWHVIQNGLIKFSGASEQYSFARGTGLPGRVWASRKPVWIRDVTKDTNFPRSQLAAKAGLKAGVGIPVLMDREVIAVMDFFVKETREEEEHFIELIGGVAAQLGSVLQRKKAEEQVKEGYRRLQVALSGIIDALASTVETRDPYTAGHQKEVARLAAAIARELGLSEDRIHVLRMASALHDLGKITVPAEILSKPGVINENEFNIIKTHPSEGHRILKSINFPWPIARIVHEHHERLDGSGYPQGLKGEGIIEEARIMAVADVVEAMAAHRPYRPARGIEAALAEIREKSGLLYDEKVVVACLRLFEAKGFTLE